MKRKNTVPPCAPEVEAKGSLGTGQRQSAAARKAMRSLPTGDAFRVTFIQGRESVRLTIPRADCETCKLGIGSELNLPNRQGLWTVSKMEPTQVLFSLPLSSSKTPARKRTTGAQGGQK